MDLGFDHFFECPTCKCIMRKNYGYSFNTYNSLLYSDGYSDIPDSKRYPSVSKCEKCFNYFWVKDVTIIDRQVRSEEARLIHFIKPLSLYDLKKVLESDIIKSKEDELYIRKRIWWNLNHDYRNYILDNEDFPQPIAESNNKLEQYKYYFSENSKLPPFGYYDNLSNYYQARLKSAQVKMYGMFNKKKYNKYVHCYDQKVWRENLNRILELVDEKTTDNIICKAEIYRNLSAFDKSMVLLEKINDSSVNFAKEKLIQACKEKNRYLVKF